MAASFARLAGLPERLSDRLEAVPAVFFAIEADLEAGAADVDGRRLGLGIDPIGVAAPEDVVIWAFAALVVFVVFVRVAMESLPEMLDLLV